MSEEVVISKLNMAKMNILAGKMAATGETPAKAEDGFRAAQDLLEGIDSELSNPKIVTEFYQTYHFLTDTKYLTSKEKLAEDTIRFMTICRVLSREYFVRKQYSDGITVGLDAVSKIQIFTDQLTFEQEIELGDLHRIIGINYNGLKDSEKALEHYYLSHEILQKTRKQKPNYKTTSELATILLNLLVLEKDPNKRYDLLKEESSLCYALEGKHRKGKYKALARSFEAEMRKIDPERAKEDCRWSWLKVARLYLIKFILG